MAAPGFRMLICLRVWSQEPVTSRHYLRGTLERIDKPMTASCRVALALLVVLALYPGRTQGQEIQWRDAASFEVEGKGWAGTAGPFDRLPDSAQNKVSPAVWNLSKDSAGICIRFVTDATAVSVRWSLTRESLDMPHMPATGVSGVDLYTREADNSWRFVGNGRPGEADGNLATFEFPDKATARHECLLYLPLYNGTKSLEIGVPVGRPSGSGAAAA